MGGRIAGPEERRGLLIGDKLDFTDAKALACREASLFLGNRVKFTQRRLFGESPPLLSHADGVRAMPTGSDIKV
jgi:hypothetical protein